MSRTSVTVREVTVHDEEMPTDRFVSIQGVSWFRHGRKVIVLQEDDRRGWSEWT